MRKITFLIAIMLSCLSTMHAQCISENEGPYPGDTIESNNLGIPQTIATNSYTSEFAQLSNLIVGGDYIFTCTMGNTEKVITVTDWQNNVIAFGDSPLTVEDITSSDIRLHFFDDASCGTTSENHLTTLQAVLTCSPPINILVSGITTTNATFSWEPQGEETAWEVLVQKANLPAPTATTSGAAVNTNPEYTTTILESADEYTFYVRANCGTEFSPWNKLSFASGCDPINTFNEGFDAVEEGELPICWSSIIEDAEDAYIQTVDYNGVEDSNSVEIGFGDSDDNANIILVSPAIGNLPAATHRVKFFAFAYDPATFELGTLDGSTPGATFTAIGEEVQITPGAHEYVVNFTAYEGTDTFIGFRMTSGYYVSLDDIRWELAPLCADVTEIAVVSTTINGASFEWNPGEDETEWDVVYALDAVTDPSTLTPISPAPTGTPQATISGLQPSTAYKVWVRSVCGVNDGAWIGPKKFTTPCLPTATFNEDFDTTPYDELPQCWSFMAVGPQVTEYDRASAYDGESASGPNSVRIQKDYESTEVFLISPNLSTLATGTHRIKFNALSYSFDPSLEIGTLSSTTSDAEFTMIEEIQLTDVYAEYKIDFTGYEGTDTFIGIKLKSGYSAYLDDIRWEIAPLCPDVSEIGVTALTTTAASFVWTPGGDETSWDVVYGLSTVTDPTTLTPISPSPTGTSEASISGLQPGTTYKVWVRSSCGAPDGDGAWIGPRSFTTPCLPIATFNENFDAVDYEKLPACWSTIIRGEDTPSYAAIYTVDFNPKSGPNSLRINTYSEGGSADSDVILVSPNLSTLATSDHRLKFFGRGYGPTTLQIGSVDSPSSNATFTSWQEVEITDEYAEYVVDFTGYEGTDTFVAIRHEAGDTCFLDDIRWELAPLCADVQDIAVSEITTTAATVSWSPGGSETSWQVVYGTADVTDPLTLTPSTVLTETTFDLSSLAVNTAYNVWVRSVCGAPDGDGAWMGPIRFNTQCLSTNVPYTQDFESAEVPELPNCSAMQNLGTGNNWYITNDYSNGFPNNALTYEWNGSNDANVWFYTQGINLTGGTEYFISYRYGNDSENYTESLRVMYGLNPDADSMTGEIADHPEISISGADENMVTFTPATTGTYYFGFQAYSEADQNHLLVDDIVVDAALKNDDFSANTLRFYPNPVKDVLNLSHTQDISTVIVYNLLGQKVIENAINAQTAKVDMSSLPTGNYIVKVSSGNHTKTIKVSKR